MSDAADNRGHAPRAASRTAGRSGRVFYGWFIIAAAALGFSLTEREEARRIQFVAGHGADGKLPADIDWSAVADPRTTTVVYMPRRTLAAFVGRALASGLASDTPALAVAWATRPEQEQVFGPVSKIAALAEALPPGAPVIVIVGRVARVRPRLPDTVIPFSRALAAS